MLKLMHRRSNAAEILERTTTIRKELPNAVLRTTVMTGFPGETLEDHELNVELIKAVILKKKERQAMIWSMMCLKKKKKDVRKKL